VTTAELSWAAASASDVAGYRVYYGTASGSYLQTRGSGVSTGTATRFTASGLTSGQIYYFAVTAYDAAGNESGYSAEASKVIQ
jgi:hypothetical protein